MCTIREQRRRGEGIPDLLSRSLQRLASDCAATYQFVQPRRSPLARFSYLLYEAATGGQTTTDFASFIGARPRTTTSPRIFFFSRRCISLPLPFHVFLFITTGYKAILVRGVGEGNGFERSADDEVEVRKVSQVEEYRGNTLDSKALEGSQENGGASLEVTLSTYQGQLLLE